MINCLVIEKNNQGFEDAFKLLKDLEKHPEKLTVLEAK